MLRQFYGDILPSEGCYCLTFIPGGRNVWVDDLDELVQASEEFIDRDGLYFGTASFTSFGTEFAGRKQDRVHRLKALRLDIDAGPEKLAKHGEDAVYATQQEALEGSMGFFRATQIVPTYVVSSGAGLHIYYCLQEAVEPAQWLRMAKALSALGNKHGLKIDPSVTEDSARILRVPGATHPNGSRVKVLRRMDVLHDAQKLSEKLGVGEAPRKFDTSVNDDFASTVQGPPSSAVKAVNHCAALREVAEARGDVQEPFWRAMIGLVKRTVEGIDIAHEWSDGYDGYDADEVERKFNAWTTGPTTCAEFGKHTKACGSCSHKGKIKSPISLGLMTAPEIEQLPEAEQEVMAPPPPPVPSGKPWDGHIPAGYNVAELSSGKTALIATMQGEKKSETGEMVPIVVTVPFTYSIFWFSQWAEADGSDDTAQVGLNLWAHGHIKRYTMDQGLVASQAKLLEYLSGKAIHTTTNRKAAQAMQDYAKAQLQHIHATRKNLKVTDHMGLRTLDSGEMVATQGKYTIFPDGTIRETMLGAQLRSLSDAFTLPVPPGTHDVWEATVWDAYIMPRAMQHVDFLKKHYGGAGMERFQLAIMLSLASPLMAFVTGEYSGGSSLPNNSALSVALYSRETARGKTTAAQSAILAYGRPAVLSNDSGKAGATVNGRLGTLSLHGTLPSIMDETSDLTPAEVATTVSSVANGAGKRTFTTNRSLRQESTWALINIITTNVSQRDMVAAARSAAGPVLYRMLEIDVDGMPEFAQGVRADFRNDWTDVNRDCPGALGAVIHREICKLGLANMLKLVTKCVSRAEEFVKADQSARFQSRGLGAMLALNLILKNIGISMFDVPTLTNVFKEAHDSNVDFVSENTLPNDPLSLLSMALVEMAKDTIVTQEESWGQSGRGVDIPLNVKYPDEPVGRHILSTGVTYLSVDALKKWCQKHGVGERSLISMARQTGVLKTLARKMDKGREVNVSSDRKALTRGMKGDMKLTLKAYTFDVRKLNGILRTEETGFQLVTDGFGQEATGTTE